MLLALGVALVKAVLGVGGQRLTIGWPDALALSKATRSCSLSSAYGRVNLGDQRIEFLAAGVDPQIARHLERAQEVLEAVWMVHFGYFLSSFCCCTVPLAISRTTFISDTVQAALVHAQLGHVGDVPQALAPRFGCRAHGLLRQAALLAHGLLCEAALGFITSNVAKHTQRGKPYGGRARAERSAASVAAIGEVKFPHFAKAARPHPKAFPVESWASPAHPEAPYRAIAARPIAPRWPGASLLRWPATRRAGSLARHCPSR